MKTTEPQAQPPERIWLDSVDCCRDDLGSGIYYTGKPSIASVEYVREDLPRAAADTWALAIEILEWLNFDTSLDMVQSDISGIQEILERSVCSAPRAEKESNGSK